MVYVDERDVEVFTVKLTLVMFWRESNDLVYSSKKKRVAKCVV